MNRTERKVIAKENGIDDVHFEDVHWYDIDWSNPIHIMETCEYCGCDGAEGHQNACRYLFQNQQTPAGREWLRQNIKQALLREGRIHSEG